MILDMKNRKDGLLKKLTVFIICFSSRKYGAIHLLLPVAFSGTCGHLKPTAPQMLADSALLPPSLQWTLSEV